MFRSLRIQRYCAAFALLAVSATAFLSGYSIAFAPGSGPSSTITDEAVPAGFSAQFGYTPVVQDGRPSNPHGSCSSPIPLPARFEPACRVHDYGYDLLRFAARNGTVLSPDARAQLDAELIADMHRRCSNPLCHLAADLSRAGLALNTWRQRGGDPVTETTAQVATSYLTRTVETLVAR